MPRLFWRRLFLCLLIATPAWGHEPAPPTKPTVAANARLELVRQGEAALARGDARNALDWFERAGDLGHEADAELGQLRAMLQAGEFRRALAFAAHIAGVHQDESAGAGIYAWLPHLSGQTLVAQQTLARALARLPGDPVLLATGDLLRAAQPRPDGLLLKIPARFAPNDLAAPGLLATLAPVGSGLLSDDGRSVIGSAPEAGDKVGWWVRDGRGRVVAARVVQRDPTSGLVELHLATALPAPARALAAPPRDPFPGSPAYALGYASAATATPTWPLLRIGFLGAATDHTGVYELGIEAAPGQEGGPVFDAAGRLAGIAIEDRGGRRRIILPSLLRRQGLPVPAAVGVATTPARLAIDEIYEHGLARVVHILGPR